MASVEQTRQYFDELAPSLGSDSLVNKWPAIEPMFGGVDANAHAVECGAGRACSLSPRLSGDGQSPRWTCRVRP